MNDPVIESINNINNVLLTFVIILLILAITYLVISIAKLMKSVNKITDDIDNKLEKLDGCVDSVARVNNSMNDTVLEAIGIGLAIFSSYRKNK